MEEYQYWLGSLVIMVIVFFCVSIVLFAKIRKLSYKLIEMGKWIDNPEKDNRASLDIIDNEFEKLWPRLRECEADIIELRRMGKTNEHQIKKLARRAAEEKKPKAKKKKELIEHKH